jgi:hypothetical protein
MKLSEAKKLAAALGPDYRAERDVDGPVIMRGKMLVCWAEDLEQKGEKWYDKATGRKVIPPESERGLEYERSRQPPLIIRYPFPSPGASNSAPSITDTSSQFKPVPPATGEAPSESAAHPRRSRSKKS